MAERTDRYEAMEQGKANAECSRRDSRMLVSCPKCEGKVFLHCDSCKIQITGCLCTEIDRFGDQAEGVTKIYERMIERMPEEEARMKLAKAGLWLPPQRDN